MNKFSCLLVDDEPPALEILNHYISETPVLQVVKECHHAMAAFEFLQQHQVDLIFLDVQMPRLLGTELLRSLPHAPKVIFTTAYRDYAVEGFELGAVDYLLKPYSFDRFLRAVHKVLDLEQRIAPSPATILSKQTDRFLYVRADRKMVKVMVDEIRYIESLKDYVRIFVRDQQIITKQTITALEEMLPETEFMRIHRSFIVAVKKVDSYDHHSVFVSKTELPVGPLYKQEIMKRLSRISTI
ncbi:MAG TPA: LytTR family DNA-binding domain-containing protein [Chryseolinea sp.]